MRGAFAHASNKETILTGTDKPKWSVFILTSWPNAMCRNHVALGDTRVVDASILTKPCVVQVHCEVSKISVDRLDAALMLVSPAGHTRDSARCCRQNLPA